MKAFLILEDGTVFEGTHIGADKEIISEVVFETSVVGYLEVLTDPAYAGKAVCMTYPLIGNYGVCKEDMESGQAWADGLIVRELSRLASNFRKDITIQDFLAEQGICGIAGIDTRALTKLLREKGAMKGMITTREVCDLDEVLPKIKGDTAENLVEKVTCKEKYKVEGSKTLEENGPLSGSARFVPEDYRNGKRELCPSMVRELNGLGKKVAVLDLGVKKGIIRMLTQRGCSVTVYPAQTAAEEIMADKPDGVLISSGPGDPKACGDIIGEIKKLYETELPIFAVGLGHQLVALCAGADTYKMKCGHHGGHPVKDLATGKVYIVSQSHSYAVEEESLKGKAEAAFVNVNDGTNEGLRYTGKNILTVQYHPEGYAGPQDSGYLFDRFVKMMEG